MRLRIWLLLGVSFPFLMFERSPADEFDRVEGETLARIGRGEDATRRDRLSLRDLEAFPAVLGDTRAAFFVVKTDQGHLARILASSALRKGPAERDKPIPVVVLERFDTFEPDRSGSRLASGRGVLLFDGLPIDLDSGQIVPPGQGGDLVFENHGDAGPSLKALGSGAILTRTKPIRLDARSSGPSPGKAVVPGDFAGRYHLHADGRWSGQLDVQVGDDRALSGRFRSDANGTSYPLTGQVLVEHANKAVFTIRFPNSQQDYDAYLDGEGKNALSGTFMMGDRTFGFFAVREGSARNGNK